MPPNAPGAMYRSEQRKPPKDTGGQQTQAWENRSDP